MTQPTLTLLIAIWGALLSTAVAVWNVYVWLNKGPKLRIDLSDRMISTDARDPNEYVAVTVTNIGDAATTLNGLTLRYFAKDPGRKVNKLIPDEASFWNLFSGVPNPLPFVIEPGHQWKHLITITDKLDKQATAGFAFVVAEDSTTSKPKDFARRRLVLRKSDRSDNIK